MPTEKEIEEIIKKQVILFIEKAVRDKLDLLIDYRLHTELRSLIRAEFANGVGEAITNLLKKNLDVR